MTRTHPSHELAPVNPNFDALAGIVNRHYHELTNRLGLVATSIKDFFEDLGIFKDGPYFQE